MTDRRLAGLPRMCFRAFAMLLCLLAFATPSRGQALTTNIGTDLGAFSAGELQYALIATGGNGSYTWDVAAGALPPGVALRTDKPSWFPANASAGLIGVPTMPGHYTFTLRVRSGAAELSQPTGMTITPFTVNEQFELPDGFAGLSYSHTLTAMNNAGTVTWGATGLPAGLSIDTATGTISGTAAAGFYNFSYSANDGVNTIFRGANLRIHLLHILPDLMPNAVQGQSYGPATIGVSGGTPAYTFVLNGSLPSGLSMSSAGTISGTPTADPNPYTFTITVTDALGRSDSKTLSLFVDTAPGHLPRLLPYNSILDACTYGIACRLGIGLYSGGAGPFAVSSTGLPAGLSAKQAINTNGTFVNPGHIEIGGVPTAAGSFSPQFQVSDVNGGISSNAFALDVSNLALRNDSFSGTVGVAMAVQLRIIGGTGPYHATLARSLLPAGVSYDPSTLMISGTPTESGGFSARFDITDNNGDALHTSYYFSVFNAVPGVNINNYWDLASITTGSFYSTQLSACCASGLNWTVVGGSLPAGLALSSGGRLSGSASTPGTYKFLVKAVDAANSNRFDTRQFQLVISPFAIQTSTDLPNGFLGSPYSQLLAATGGSGPITWTVDPFTYLPPGVRLVRSALGDWSLTGTPTSGGQFNFQLFVSDGVGPPLGRYFQLVVFPAGATPTLTILTSSNRGTWMIGEIEDQLIATGGTGTYSWQVLSGTLPPGVSLRQAPELAPWFSPGASAGLIGVATAPGTYPFTLRVTSGAQARDQAFTVTIAALASADPFSLPDAYVGELYSQTLRAAGNVGPVAWVPNGQLPPGLSLTTGGVLSGTPTTAGFYGVSVAMTDSNGTTFRTSNLGIFGLHFTTSGALPNASQNVAYLAHIGVAGGTPPYNFATSGSMPPGLFLDPLTGDVTGTMTTTGLGRYSFFLTVTDADHVSFSRSMAIVLVGSGPTVASIAPYSTEWDDCTFGMPCSRGLFVSSGGKAPFSWAETGLPSEFLIRSGDVIPNFTPGDAEIFGVPRTLGTFTAHVTMRDADNIEVANDFPLRVSRLLISEFPPTGTINQPYFSRLRPIGGTPPYSGVIIEGALPVGMSFDAGALTLSGTPIENGSFHVTLRVTDSVGNSIVSRRFFSIGGGTSTVSISSSDLGFAIIGQTYGTTLFACCLPNAFTWSLVSGSLPEGLNLSADGSISGTVAATNAIGAYKFMVRAADAINPANFAIRQLTITVSNLSITSGNPPVGNVGAPFSFAFSASGGSGTRTWSLSPFQFLPLGLTLDANTGVLSGMPPAAGLVFVTVRVTDAAGNMASRGISVSVYPAGVYPPLNLNIGTNFVAQLGTFTLSISSLSISGGLGPYQVSLTPDAELPAGASQVPGMRVVSDPALRNLFGTTAIAGYAGVLATPGVYHPSIRLTDANGTTIDKVLTLTVVPFAVVSPNNLPKATRNVPYAYAPVVYGSGNFSWNGTAMPPGLSMDPLTGFVHGTPTTAGATFFRVTLTDLTTSTALNLSLNITIDPFAIVTSGALPSGTVGLPYAATFSAPDCGSPCTWAGSPGASLFMSSAGVLSGTPTNTLNSLFTVTATGPNGVVSKVFSLQIANNATTPLAVTGTTLNDVTVGGLVTQSLFGFASGGAPPYVWSLDSGDLPPGISLVSSGDLYGQGLGPNASYLIGRAMVPGIYTVTLRVTDQNGASATRALTWNVSPLAYLNTTLPVTGSTLVYNQAYTQPLLALGGSNSYSSWTNLAPLPPGLTLDPSSGIVSGTPTNTGTFTAPIRVADGDGKTFTGTWTFIIAGPTATSLNIALTAITTTTGLQVSANVTPTNGTAPYTISALTPLPPGLILANGNDPFVGGAAPGQFLLTGVPTTAGAYSVTLRAEDSAPVPNVGVKTITVTVLGMALLTSSLPDASVGAPYAYTLVAFDPAGPTISSVAANSAMPPGLSLAASGAITGIPTQAGLFSFVVNVNGPSGVVTRAFTLNVSAITILDGGILPTGIVGTPYNHTLASTGGASTVLWSSTGMPPGLTISSLGAITGTPSSSGIFSIFITATDGVRSILRVFALPIRQLVPPVLDIALNSTRLNDLVVGATATLFLNASNGVPPYSWRVPGGSTLPPGLQLLSGTSLPAATFTPGTTLLAGMPTTVGSYTFDLIATDAVGTEVRRTYTVNVTRIALLAGTIPTAIAGTPFSTRFVATGGTGPYTFTMSAVNGAQDTLPPGFSLTSAGQISGTTNSTGTYVLSLKVQDAVGNSITRTLSLTVTNASGLRVLTTNPPDLWIGGGLNGETDLRTNGSSTYTWTHTAGTLPPGVHLVTGIGGPNSTELVGAPTTPGVYTFTLRATDDANASNFAEHVFAMRVAPMQIVSPPLGLLADLQTELPSGHAGVPYSFTFKAAGGTPPYSFAQSPFQQLPAGLSLSASGVLSGTTTLTGRFIVAPVVTDAAGRVLNIRGLGLVIAPAGAPVPLVLANFDGDLPGASAGVPYTFPIDRLIRTGIGPFTWAVAPATPPAVNALPTGMTLVSGSNGVDSYLAGTPSTPGDYSFVLIVTDSNSQSLTVPMTLSVSRLALTPDSLPPGRAGSPYAQTLVPSGGTAPYSVALYPPSDLPVGLTFSSGVLSGIPTGAGNYLICVIATDAGGNSLFKVYRVAIDNAIGEAPALAMSPKPIQIYYEIGSPNPPPVPVTITTTSGAQPFSLAMSSVPGASLSAGSGTTNATVNLNLSLTSLAAGSYSGLIGGNAPNSANLIDAVPVSVTIARAPGCTFTANPAARGAPTAGESKTFAVLTAAGCRWTAVPSDSWITITSGSSGIGNGTVAYTVAPNPGATERTATISVNGVLFTITQFGAACTYTLSPGGATAPASGGLMFVAVFAPVGCSWGYSSTDLILSPPPVGKVGVSVTVPANPSIGRTLTATIAGQVFRVQQSGIECTATLSPYGTTVPAGGSTGSVSIALPAACSYGTVLGPSWINVTSGGSGVGPGTVVYSVDANSTTLTRSGALIIGGQSFVITQDPLACSVTVDTASLGSPYGPSGTTGAIGISANGANCSWTASSALPWLSLSPTSGTGNGTIGVTVISNAASPTGRSGSFSVAGQTVNVSQAGTTCTFELGSPTGSAPAAGGAGSVRVTAAAVCAWTAGSNAPWLSITATGTGGTSDVRFAATANDSALPRSGTLTIAATTYTVNQAGAACAFAITGSSTSPTFAANGASAQTFGFSSTLDGCAAPPAVSYASWITVDGATFSGRTGSATYTVAPNPFGTSRRGTIQVGSGLFTVVQSGAACAYSLNEYGHVFHASGGDATALGSPTAPACTPAVGTDQPDFITLAPLSGPDLNIFSLPYTVSPFGTLSTLVRYGRVTFGGQVVLIKQYSW